MWPSGGSITVNAGLLSLLNNGAASNSQILYSAPIVGGLGAAAVNLQIGNAGSNTGNTIELASVSLAGGQILNIAGNNSYNLQIDSLASSGTAAVRLNPSAGTKVTVLDYNGLKPVNIGLGTVIFPDLVTIGTVSALNNSIVSNGTITLGAGALAPMAVRVPAPLAAAACAARPGAAACAAARWYDPPR